MKRDALLTQQVLALRSAAVTVVTQADALLFTLEPDEEVTPAATVNPDGSCAHPEAKREPTPSGADLDAYVCIACGKSSDEIGRTA